LILAIEEPELYQHPNRQRHLSKIFLQLASGKTPGVAEKTQIIYTTHAPLLVGLDRINQIRLLRKVPNGDGKPKITKVVSTTSDELAEVLWRIDGETEPKYTGLTVLPGLQTIMTPLMNEGFFADVAVLVEGEDDRAAIFGIAKALGHDLEAKGISVIPSGGKASIDRPYIIFHQLGIPVYIIWDGDYGKGETEGVCEKCGRNLDKKPDPKYNRRILRLFGRAETDWPEYVEDKFACFKYVLETTLRNEIGDKLFEEYLEACQSDYCICKRKHAMKNPNVIMTIITKAKEQGRSSNTIENIVKKILALKGVSNP
jgi:predicted ATP-dependent endonuclease of OLD family